MSSNYRYKYKAIMLTSLNNIVDSLDYIDGNDDRIDYRSYRRL